MRGSDEQGAVEGRQGLLELLLRLEVEVELADGPLVRNDAV